MNKYIIHGQSFTGDIVLCYFIGKFVSVDVSQAQLTDKQLEQWLNNISINESEFLLRAKKSKANFELCK